MGFTKQFLAIAATSLISAMVLPALIVGLSPSTAAETMAPTVQEVKKTDSENNSQNTPKTDAQDTQKANTQTTQDKTNNNASTAPSTKITVYFHETGEVKTVDLEEYLVGVLAAEVPPTFEMEALKAQAVAARTYILYKKNFGGDAVKAAHKGADVCDDYKHCKAYISVDKAREKWGDHAEEYLKRIGTAVSDTRGMVAVYQNKIINAVFHAASSGRTENAEDVWGTAVPYLVSTESKGDLNDEQYFSTVTLSPEDFKRVISDFSPNAEFPKNISDWIGKSQYTTGGNISTIKICGVDIKGVKVRELFNLKSATFNLYVKNGNFVFDVRGYGHGVGMSQNGAEYMAKQGKTYTDIIKWYYHGSEIMDYYTVSGQSA
ncbi:MAG: stage II sporulation protein D [Bacillota bacterium]|nr:stage II sporulation protein D [Bacillota bacterium]